ncbi:hypothetical protein ACRAWF_32890 [Streptomyces sp. L7]
MPGPGRERVRPASTARWPSSETFSGTDLLVLAQIEERGRDRLPRSGTDVFRGPPAPGPPSRTTSTPTTSTVSAVPLRPRHALPIRRVRRGTGGRAEARSSLNEMTRARHGEVVFAQQGEIDLVIPIVIGREPGADEHRAAPGESAFNTWVNDQLAELHGIQFSDAPPPANKLLWDIRSTDGRS